ncbi:Restriction endonuclease type II-like protein [Pseudocohnilembus persalinus]|uniref:Crossover junction endonuclease MUS81 n=1 Tax=Pseudocohnilembus persalinus TaxID=266149 RepID=A0A0V0QS63_PSEPJ|nr:Restriction endonuclease type II-like protein [Pseudocohnilembus persalinus]|eukprot:KRX04858.1 Restriction endonuclease type II-like protein [Pseudocohnilembus persalinus]
MTAIIMKKVRQKYETYIKGAQDFDEDDMNENIQQQEIGQQNMKKQNGQINKKQKNKKQQEIQGDVEMELQNQVNQVEKFEESKSQQIENDNLFSRLMKKQKQDNNQNTVKQHQQQFFQNDNTQYSQENDFNYLDQTDYNDYNNINDEKFVDDINYIQKDEQSNYFKKQYQSIKQIQIYKGQDSLGSLEFMKNEEYIKEQQKLLEEIQKNKQKQNKAIIIEDSNSILQQKNQDQVNISNKRDFYEFSKKENDIQAQNIDQINELIQKKQPQPIFIQIQDESQQELNSSIDSNNNSGFQNQIENSINQIPDLNIKQNTNQNNTDNSTTQNTKNVQKKKYMPKPNTNPYNLLVAIYCYSVQKNKTYVSKQNIKDIVKELRVQDFDIQVKNYNGLNVLKDKEIINIFSIKNEEKIELTNQGKQLAAQFYEDILKKKLEQKDNNCEIITDSESENESQKENSKKSVNQNLHQKNNQIIIQEKSRNNLTQKGKNDKNLLMINEVQSEEDIDDVNKYESFNYKIYLLIDNREKNKKGEEENEIQKRIEKFGIDAELTQLPLGDFLWTIELELDQEQTQYYLLDTVVERKKADDLAASIQDKRYKDQKKRLKFSKIKNIIYLLEGQASKNCILPQSVLEKAILHTSVKDGIKIKNTATINETVKWLASMTISIQKSFERKYNQLAENQCLEFNQTYEDYENRNKKHANVDIGQQLGYMLFVMKQSGDNAVYQILNVADTPYKLYEYIQKLKIQMENLKNIKKRQYEHKTLLDLMTKQFIKDCKENCQEKIPGIRGINQKQAESLIKLFCNLNDSCYYNDNQYQNQNSLSNNNTVEFSNQNNKKQQKPGNKKKGDYVKNMQQTFEFQDFKSIKKIIDSEDIFSKNKQYSQKNKGIIQQQNHKQKININLQNSFQQPQHQNMNNQIKIDKLDNILQNIDQILSGDDDNKIFDQSDENN